MNSSAEKEWLALQYQYDNYEKMSLIIKLISVAVCSLLIFHDQLDFAVTGLCAILWMLDGIWKTFQSRISDRLLAVENLLKNDEGGAMQFHSEWASGRPSSVGLILGYVKSGLTPTVLFPHACIVGLTLLVKIVG